MKIVLNRVRLSFPQLWKPVQVNGEGKPAFSASFIVPLDHPQIGDIETMIEQLAAERWKTKAKAVLAQLRAQDKVLLHNGDLKANYEGYQGNYYISARSAARPLVIDRDKSVLTEQDGRPYGGCYVNASIEGWAQDNQWGRRINATLRGVQFAADGDAFAGGTPALPDEFPDLGVGSELV